MPGSAPPTSRDVAGRYVVDVVVLEEIAQQIQTAAIRHPRIHLARVHAERDRAVETEGRVLADVVVAGGVPDLDRVVLYRVEHLQGRHDLAAGKGADLELVVGRLAD